MKPKRRKTIGCQRTSCRLTLFEALEPRVVLTGQLAWADTTQLTISFAPQGTDIGGAPNEIHSLFDSFGPIRWKRTILTAFQTWAAPTAANVGLVEEQLMRTSDETVPVDPLPVPAGEQNEPIIGVQPPNADGDSPNAGNPDAFDDEPDVPMEVGFPFGTPGPRTDDPRFGDIRIGARPLSPEIKAIAVSHDTVISGTWSGDVIFNSRSRFASLDEVLAIALHESGHVFGLEHSEDPESPMFEHLQNRIVRPTEEDYVAVKQRQGERTADQYEGQLGNDTVETATEIDIPRTISLVDGAVPAIIFAGLHQGSDTDFYRIPKIAGNSGSVSVEVRTLGISQLAPSLAVLAPDGSTQVQDSRIGGSVVELQLPTTDIEGDLFLQVSSARGPNDIFSVGDYSLVVTYESTSIIDADSVNSISTDRVRSLSQIEIQSLLDPSNNLINDGVIDETPANSVDLAVRPGFEPFTFYEAVGSISGADDHDFYRIRAPVIPEDSGDVYLQTNLRSLQDGQLMPSAAIYRGDQERVASEIIANANGEFVLQTKLESNINYFVEVRAADAFTEFQRGNYRLMVYFTDVEIELEETVSGEANLTDRKGHKLFVAQSHLFHFALDTSAVHDIASSQIQNGIIAQIYSDEPQPIYQVSAPLGTRRTSHSVLLSPGTYVVQVFAISLEDDQDLRFSYQFLASQISDPIAVPPDDPSNDPLFECPGEEGKYCYPGGVESYDPYLWEEFIETIPDPPDLPIEDLIDALFGDWWNWYWSQVNNNSAPVAVPDAADVDPGDTLQIAELEGVLTNDSDANGDTLKSILVDDATYGDLSLGLDGEFVYTPNPGFVGTDRFRYAAYDYVDPSNPVWVTLRVASSSGVEGDFDGDGELNVVDVDLLSAAIQGTQDPVFDINVDGQVDIGDLDYLIHNVFGTTYGDTNLDGLFNSIDIILTFQAGHYEDLIEDNSTWREGDWNADSDFTTADVIAAFNDGGYANPAVESNALVGVIELESTSKVCLPSKRHGKNQ